MSSVAHRFALPLLSLALGSGALLALPERQAPHERWREAHAAEPALIERWFVPTELGHEPGLPPPPPGPRAYLSRFFWGSDRHDGGRWNQLNGISRGPAFSHNLSGVFPPALFDTNPEFFPWINGERWRPPAQGPVNWNPDLGEPAVAAHAAETAIRHFDANPDAISFALGINDGLRFGESPATLRWITPTRYFRGRPDYSDLVYNFMNRAAERVATVHPDKHLGSLAYYWCEQVPSFPVHPQVMPFLTADRSQGYDRAFLREEEDLQRRWAAAGPERLGIYDYIYGYGYLVPRIHTELLARNLRHARRAGFTDYFAEVNAHWGLSAPQNWMVAQLLLDPERDHRAVLDEFYTRFYRDAAGPMRRFFELCEERWMGQGGPVLWLKHYLNDSQAALFPPEVRRRLRASLDEAESRVAHDPVARQRVELTSAAFRVSERYVELVEHRRRLALALVAAWRDGDETAAATEAEAPGKALEPVASLHALLAAEREARRLFASEVAEVRQHVPLAFGQLHDEQALQSNWGPVTEWLLEGGRARLASAAEFMPNPRWLPPHSSEQRIAGLLYKPALPLGWDGRTEPWEGLVAEPRRGAGGAPVFRFENVKFGDFRCLALVPGRGEGLLKLRLDGRLGPLSRVWLRAFWISADKRNLGEAAAIQLPAGEWSEMDFPTLLTKRPDGATAVLCKLTLLDQQAGEWLDLRSISLRWMPTAE